MPCLQITSRYEGPVQFAATRLPKSDSTSYRVAYGELQLRVLLPTPEIPANHLSPHERAEWCKVCRLASRSSAPPSKCGQLCLPTLYDLLESRGCQIRLPCHFPRMRCNSPHSTLYSGLESRGRQGERSLTRTYGGIYARTCFPPPPTSTGREKISTG